MNEVKKVVFKKIYAENFLCFGSEGITIDFENYNNIVLIKGKNIDIVKTAENAEKNASNGVGKSSIPTILVYGLYGKTIRKPNKISHKDIINHVIGKKLKVEVYWDEYKLQRTRKPDALRLWKSKEGVFDDSTEITLGGMPATQKLIEDIIGMTYDTFTNVSIFSDDTSNSFLECDASSKRAIVENLLSLEKYRTYHENAKKILKTHKDFIKSLEKDIQYVEKAKSDEEGNLSRLLKSQQEWKQNKNNEITKLSNLISSFKKEKEEAESDDSELQAYEKILAQIKELESKISEIDNTLPTLDKSESIVGTNIGNKTAELASKSSEYSDENLNCKNILGEIAKIKTDISKIENLEDGVKCQHCLSIVDKASHSNVLESLQKDLKINQEKFDSSKAKKDSLYTEVEEIKSAIAKLQQKQTVIKTAISKYRSEKDSLSRKLNDLLKIKKPEENAKIKAIQLKIDIANGQLEDKIKESANPSPYDELVKKSESNIESIKEKFEAIKKEYDLKNSKTKFYDFWVTAFGDSGIRKYVIDEIIPALNSNIGYWMQFLIENKISLKFDNEFNETIEKQSTENNTYLYECMSNGQRRRINLALSQAFAHVMSLNSGKTPNIVFLDEVTSNIDPQGVVGIYNMICELAKEKQVFVTTHDHDLIEFLNGCDSLNLVMRNGITKLEK